MLRYLRTGGKYTKLIWWILTVVTVVTFVFMFNAFGFMGNSGPRQTGVSGYVDNSPISVQDYQQALANQREAFKRQTGSDPTDQDEKTVEIQAWRNLVTQKLLARQARAAGLTVSDREVVLALETQPPQELIDQPVFQTNGKFDPAKYQAALRDPNSGFWGPFEQLTRQQLPVRKLEERLLSSIKVSEPELRQAYRDRFDRLSATVVEVPPDMQAKIAPPTQADMDRVYQQYKGRFNSGPRVDLEILAVPMKFSDEDVRAARQTAQSIVDRARQGDDFAALARDFSEGPNAAQGGVINRVIQPAELGPDLGPHVSALKVGAVSDPYQDAGRFIILKVLERVPQPNTPTEGLRLAQILVRVHAGEGTMRQQFEELDKLRGRAAALKSLGRAATEKGLTTQRTGFFDMNSAPPQLYGVPEAVDWAFGAKPGTVSPIFEGTDSYVLVQVADKLTGGEVPRDKIGDALRQIAEIEARITLAKPAADRVAQALAQGRTLEEAAKAAGLTPFTVQDMTRLQPDQRLAAAPELVGRLFAAAPGQTVGPVREPSGWYLARLDQHVPAPMDSTYDRAKGAIAQQIMSARQQAFFNGWVGDLRMKAKVQDLRQGPR